MKKDFEEGDMKITIDYDKCTGAGECVTACPVEIFELVDGKAIAKNVGECIQLQKMLENVLNAVLVSAHAHKRQLNTVPVKILV